MDAAASTRRITTEGAELHRDPMGRTGILIRWPSGLDKTTPSAWAPSGYAPPARNDPPRGRIRKRCAYTAAFSFDERQPAAVRRELRVALAKRRLSSGRLARPS
jgi:hypothetical protein